MAITAEDSFTSFGSIEMPTTRRSKKARKSLMKVSRSYLRTPNAMVSSPRLSGVAGVADVATVAVAVPMR